MPETGAASRISSRSPPSSSAAISLSPDPPKWAPTRSPSSAASCPPRSSYSAPRSIGRTTTMTPPETDGRRQTTDRRRRVAALREWSAIPANVTRGWLIFVLAIAFAFLLFSVYVTVQVVRLDNRVTRDRLEAAIADQVESCQAGNDS